MRGVNRIVEAAEKMGQSADALLDPRITIKWDKAQNKWLWVITPEAHNWIYSNEDISFMAKQCMAPVFKDRQVTFVDVDKK